MHPHGDDTTAISRSRAEAFENGHSTYFTGKSCPQGHIAHRFRTNSYCCECNKSSCVTYHFGNHSAMLARMSIYGRNNRDKAAARGAKRRALKLLATPSWLTATHYDAIRVLYTKSAAVSELTGIPFHVDHIVPLQGELVCGLHVPWNLQVLPAYENLSKSNKHEI